MKIPCRRDEACRNTAFLFLGAAMTFWTLQLMGWLYETGAIVGLWLQAR